MNKFKWQLLTTSAVPHDGDGGGGAPADWISKVTDQETIGYLQNRGLDKKPIEEALLATIGAHRAAEKHLGVPSAELVRLPKPEATPEQKKEFYQRLGMPADPKDYDLTAVKDEKLNGALRTAAANAGLSKDAAASLATALAAHFTEVEKEKETLSAANLTAEREKLMKEWGSNFEANKLVAQNAARALNLDPEIITKIEKIEGYGKIMEMFRSLGQRMGEDKFVTPPNKSGVMTAQQAMDRKATLKADSGWVAKFLAGDAAAVAEMAALDKIIVESK